MLDQPVLYFAYGANMCRDAMQFRCPDAQSRGAFLLRNWELQFYCHATIEPRSGSAVAGVLWALTPECEYSLDRFEGFPDYYTKRTWQQDDPAKNWQTQSGLCGKYHYQLSRLGIAFVKITDSTQ
jgi:hypothetical protein